MPITYPTQVAVVIPNNSALLGTLAGFTPYNPKVIKHDDVNKIIKYLVTATELIVGCYHAYKLTWTTGFVQSPDNHFYEAFIVHFNEMNLGEQQDDILTLARKWIHQLAEELVDIHDLWEGFFDKNTIPEAAEDKILQLREELLSQPDLRNGNQILIRESFDSTDIVHLNLGYLRKNGPSDPPATKTIEGEAYPLAYDKMKNKISLLVPGDKGNTRIDFAILNDTKNDFYKIVARAELDDTPLYYTAIKKEKGNGKNKKNKYILRRLSV